VVYNKNPGLVIAAVVLFVDDLHLILDKGCIGQIEDQLKKSFGMQDLGRVSIYLLMHIKCNPDNSMINIHQHRCIRTMLAKVRMHRSRPVGTPIAMTLPKRKPEKETCNLTVYQLMIASNIYPMTASRPDIEYAIGLLCQSKHDPSNEHMVAL
jgi:hypothetical protein